jgi:preprotein translocase subunit SecG
MIIAILTVLHIIMCVALILIVLLQTGKGSELAGAFGGGTSNTAFGVTGAISLIGKLTTVAAFCFLITSFSLSLLPRSTGGGSSVIKEETTSQVPESPVENAAKGVEDSKSDEPADAASFDAEVEKSESEESYPDGADVSSDVTTGSEETGDSSESDLNY